MSLKGNADRYGRLAIAFHWTVALAIPALIVLGIAAANTGDASREVRLLRVHVVVGVAVLLLTVLRAMWWSLDRRPRPVAGISRWQHRIARTTHVLLYLVPVVAAVSGIGLLIMSQAASTLFGGSARPLPRFADFPPMAAHVAAAVLIVVLVLLHVAAALHHQLIKRDRILSRLGVGQPG